MFGHNGQAKHNNALIINIPKQSRKHSLKSTSAASFNAAANRFLFHIETTRVKITQGNIENIKEVLAPDRCYLLPDIRLTADEIRFLISEKKVILADQQDTLSELEQELDELLDKEVLGRSREGAIPPTFCKLQTGDESAGLAGGLDNVALGSLSVVNGGQDNQALGTSSVIGGSLDNLSKGTNCVVGGGESNTASGTSIVIGGGFNYLAQDQDDFLGGAEKNQLKGQLAALGEGKFNIVSKSI